jgi:hypothetical protein
MPGVVAVKVRVQGGIAYAGTAGSHPAPAQPATTTVQVHSQHPTGQPRHDRCDGDYRYDHPDHGYQQHATQQPVTQRQATQHHGDRNDSGYQGSMGYQGEGSDQAGHHGDHDRDGCDR